MRADRLAAIVGIGTTGFDRSSDRSAAWLASSAVDRALADAGLQRNDVDGLLVHIGSPRGVDYDTLASQLALEVRFSAQTWAHGRFGATVIQHAAMALNEGLANFVLCVSAVNNSRFAKYGMQGFPGFEEALREGGGPHAETHSAGLAAPIGGAALATRRYFHMYGIDRGKLGAVAVAQRKAAQLNPLAVLRAPLTMETYEAAPFIVEPLRVLDCSVPVDGAVAVVMTNANSAALLRQSPVYLLSFQGLKAGPDEFVFGQPGLGINQANVFDFASTAENHRIFAETGLGPQNIDTLQCYDGFSPQVLWTLERFGFCDVGAAADWIQGGRIELGGELPVNTSGGHLSEGHTNGWGHTLEIVNQLRNQAGARQIPNCHCALWATTLGDAILYTNELP